MACKRSPVRSRYSPPNKARCRKHSAACFCLYARAFSCRFPGPGCAVSFRKFQSHYQHFLLRWRVVFSAFHPVQHFFLPLGRNQKAHHCEDSLLFHSQIVHHFHQAHVDPSVFFCCSINHFHTTSNHHGAQKLFPPQPRRLHAARVGIKNHRACASWLSTFSFHKYPSYTFFPNQQRFLLHLLEHLS